MYLTIIRGQIKKNPRLNTGGSSCVIEQKVYYLLHGLSFRFRFRFFGINGGLM